ncbi:hypothetical protein CsatB_021771 [Cannabis sativa]
MASTSVCYTQIVLLIMMIIFIMLQKNCVKTQLVPAVFIFGDSIVDVGNNNNLPTLVKANFPPYGRDFANHRSTGRFSNGKLAIDYLVDTLQLGSYPQAYLSTHGVSNELLIGANFASAASGYDDSTANLYNLHSMGARRIGVASLAPLGCLPGAITIFGFGNNNQCVDRLNYDAMYFNTRLNSTSQILRNRLSNLNLLVLDIYQPLYNLIVNNPIQNGFYETRKGCCGLGTIETALLCNSLAIGTCSNASHHIFWDAFHPSDAANNLLSSYMTIAGASLLN